MTPFVLRSLGNVGLRGRSSQLQIGSMLGTAQTLKPKPDALPHAFIEDLVSAIGLLLYAGS